VVLIERAWGARGFRATIGAMRTGFRLAPLFNSLHVVLINSPPHGIRIKNNDSFLKFFTPKYRRFFIYAKGD
jgi:hypothetical protein